jgi:subtilisin-like proprotein convertase family protein
VALAVALTAAFLPGIADAAKKGPRSVDVTMPVNAPIPDAAPAPGLNGRLSSTIQVGKSFKGKRIRDVNVSLQTTGFTGSIPAKDLRGYLTAPNGTTIPLFSHLGLTGTGFSIGPLTLDDESALSLGFGAKDDPSTLEDPWVGTAQPDDPGLYVLDNGPVRGTWTFTVLDVFNGATSRLDFWRLNVTAGRPYLTR